MSLNEILATLAAFICLGFFAWLPFDARKEQKKKEKKK
jgi:hypothetical protein